jgi:hypothetical protein
MLQTVQLGMLQACPPNAVGASPTAVSARLSTTRQDTGGYHVNYVAGVHLWGILMEAVAAVEHPAPVLLPAQHPRPAAGQHKTAVLFRRRSTNERRQPC